MKFSMHLINCEYYEEGVYKMIYENIKLINRHSTWSNDYNRRGLKRFNLEENLVFSIKEYL